MNATLYDDDYTGPRWAYLLTHRPLMIGTLPRDVIVGSLRPDPTYGFGRIEYARELTAEEVDRYELVDLTAVEKQRWHCSALWVELLAANEGYADVFVTCQYETTLTERTAAMEGDLSTLLFRLWPNLAGVEKSLTQYVRSAREEAGR